MDPSLSVALLVILFIIVRFISRWPTVNTFSESSFLAISQTLSILILTCLVGFVQGTCLFPAETGPCKASIPRYHFNYDTQKCEKFTYGGCDGNPNNFETKRECYKTCKRKLYFTVKCFQFKRFGRKSPEFKQTILEIYRRNFDF